MGTLVGTFERYPPLTCWVKVGRIVSEPSMYSAWTHWVIDPLPPVSGSVGWYVLYIFFLSFRASHRFLPRFSPYSSLSPNRVRHLGLWCASVVAIPRLFFSSGVFPVPGKSRLPSRSSLVFFLVVCLFLFFFFSPLLLCFASS